MNRHLEFLLQLQELVLMRQARETMQPGGHPADFELLEQKIKKLRHKLPGGLLSQFDALIRQAPDAVAQLSPEGQCLGCHQAVPSRLAVRVQQGSDLVRCQHCGRFLFSEHQAPPYLGL